MLRLPCELVLTESFAPPDRQIARERIDLALRRLRSADEEAVAERARDARRARRARRRRRPASAITIFSLLVRARDLAELDAAMATAAAGARRHRRDRGARGRQPGARVLGPVPRQRGLPRPPGPDLDRQHGRLRLAARLRRSARPPATTGATRSRCSRRPARRRIFFNFHEGDLGNFSVIGPSGSGKTVVMNFLAAQAQKFEPAHDPVRQGPRRRDLPARGIGGHYRPLRPGEPTGFNPLRAARQRRQPGLPARLAGRAAQGRRARGAGDDRRRGRRGLRHDPSLPPPALFPRAARRRAPARSRRPRRRASTRGSTTASMPGCSTTTTTSSTCRRACSAST